jgi:GDPmannose 4,6-dehydratase
MDTKPIALITGITGQDGSYLAELLLSKGYEVHGVKRRYSSFNTERVDHLYDDSHARSEQLNLHFGDMTDATNLIRIVEMVQPTEIYNLGAQSHVQVSFEMAEYTANVDAIGTTRLLEAIRLLGMEDTTKFYQASSSEMFGLVTDGMALNEESRFYPRSPYAVEKLSKIVTLCPSAISRSARCDPIKPPPPVTNILIVQ